jgi:hypothetical protein
MTGDWRDFRPALWLAMLGVAVALLLNSALYAAPFLGGAIGISIRVLQARRGLAQTPPRRKRSR